LQLTLKLKINPTVEQAQILQNTAIDYIALVNDIVEYALGQGKTPKLTSKGINAPLPSAIKNQCIRDAKSTYSKCRKTHIHHVLNKPVVIWNNQNYIVGDNAIYVPLLVERKCCRVAIPVVMTQEALNTLHNCKLGSLRVTKKNGKYIAQIAYEHPEADVQGNNIMGIYLGLKCPAVCTTADGKVKFMGNGRQNKYVRRHYNSKRRKMQKGKKRTSIVRNRRKESRVMNDIDHKLSREIVNFASANGVSVIKMEAISGIRATAKTSRKNNHSLHSWTFYRLASYIEYKANLLGIEVTYINPAYTSQKCPHCGKLNHAKDRDYGCSCGYHGHRDIVGAINIMNAPVASGNSLSA